MKKLSCALPLVSLAIAACGGPSDPVRDAAITDAASLDTGADAIELDTASIDASGDDASIGDDGPGSDASDATGDAQMPTSQPNIVVIMADDLDLAGFSRLLAMGRLPHIARAIADRGFTFNNYFAANPLCCPSRASFLSGQYSHNTGVHSNGEGNPASGPPEGGMAAFDDRSTLATWLHAAGYRTALVGKYLNGYGVDLPRGYSGSVSAERYVPPGWDDWHALQRGTYNMYGYFLNENGTVSPQYTMYQTDKLADIAVDVIDRASRGANAAHPLFLEVTTVAPHIELPTPDAFVGQTGGAIRPPPRYVGAIDWPLPSPPSLNEADVSDKPGYIQMHDLLTAGQLADLQNLYQQRMEATMGVDDLVGRVVDALRTAGRLDNTVLVFMSDNGYLLGQHRIMGKMNPYEESIRVPLIVHLPGTTAPQDIDGFVVNSDLAPTFADLAGATIPARFTVDGRSIVPLLTGGGAIRWRRRIAIEHWEEPDGTGVPTYVGVRTSAGAADYPRRMFARFTDSGRREIYNLADDPHQLASYQNDTSANTEMMSLASDANDFDTCSGAACRSLEDR